ncbi:MAG: glycosyltransferase, partial [Candidatus Poseidoniaceae archaeon]|nr:glycosyltransferase [Candidatus Poseidoniaceae archaeon]
MRTSGPWLATVLPVLNEEAHIEACLQSLLQQSLPAEEHIIIVLDGGSSDATKEIIRTIQEGLKAKQYPEIHLFDNPGRFVPHARNLALQQLPESITHVLEFNGHIEVVPNHLFELKAA